MYIISNIKIREFKHIYSIYKFNRTSNTLHSQHALLYYIYNYNITELYKTPIPFIVSDICCITSIYHNHSKILNHIADWLVILTNQIIDFYYYYFKKQHPFIQKILTTSAKQNVHKISVYNSKTSSNVVAESYTYRMKKNYIVHLQS